MKFTHTLAIYIIVSITAVGMLPSAHADVHQQDSAAIIAKYAAFDAAAEKRDPDASVAWDALDFKCYDATGKRTINGKTDDLEQANHVLPHATNCSSKCVITKIVYDKTGATVLATESTTMTLPTPDGQLHLIRIHGVYREYWVNSQGAWLRKVSRAITEEMTLDGKPAPRS